jgi:phosphatidylglycerophosphate synthase
MELSVVFSDTYSIAKASLVNTGTGMPVKRLNNSALQFLERPALQWMARRTPHWITPDLLTGIGFAGILLSAIAYCYSGSHPAMLWVATLGLFINWVGDSLDGTLARVRKIERPRYGFFLDQNLDALGHLIFALGIGLSGYLQLEVALFTLATYYLMAMFTLVRGLVSNTFVIAYGGIGLTELRVAFALLNISLYFFPPEPFTLIGYDASYADLIALIWAVSMLITFVIGLSTHLTQLSASEPKRRR